MKEGLKTGAETFIEDQKLLYRVILIGLRRALSTSRNYEAAAEDFLAVPEPVFEVPSEMKEDKVYHLQAA